MSNSSIYDELDLTINELVKLVLHRNFRAHPTIYEGEGLMGPGPWHGSFLLKDDEEQRVNKLVTRVQSLLIPAGLPCDLLPLPPLRRSVDGETFVDCGPDWLAMIERVRAALEVARRAVVGTFDKTPDAAETCELADGQLFVKGDRPRRLLVTECAVLEAIAKHGALELGDLRAKSNVDDAQKILKSLRKKYPALQVDLPGDKGKGGYWANVKLR